MPARLIDVHSALSHLLHACQEEFPFAFVTLTYDNFVGLQVRVEAPLAKRQLVVDRLNHGVLNGPYDYRFTSVSYRPTCTKPTQEIWATVSLKDRP